LTGGKQSGQQGLAAQHAATPAAPGLGVTAAVGSDAAALAPAAETATAQAAASPGQHLQQHVPPAEQQSAANKQQQQQNRQQTEPSSSSGSTCTHQQRPAAVVASKPQDPVKTATGQTGAGPAAPQPAAPAPIKTAAIPVAADKSACVLRTSSNLPPAFLVLLQESDAALGQHPLDKVAIMDIPRVVRSCFAAPSPPSGSAGAPGQLLASGQPARPQTKARFKRVLVQSAHALSLLEYGMQQLSSHQAGAAL
jgi:hypothetical protein